MTAITGTSHDASPVTDRPGAERVQPAAVGAVPAVAHAVALVGGLAGRVAKLLAQACCEAAAMGLAVPPDRERDHRTQR